MTQAKLKPVPVVAVTVEATKAQVGLLRERGARGETPQRPPGGPLGHPAGAVGRGAASLRFRGASPSANSTVPILVCLCTIPHDSLKIETLKNFA